MKFDLNAFKFRRKLEWFYKEKYRWVHFFIQNTQDLSLGVVKEEEDVGVVSEYIQKYNNMSPVDEDYEFKFGEIDQNDYYIIKDLIDFLKLFTKKEIITMTFQIHEGNPENNEPELIILEIQNKVITNYVTNFILVYHDYQDYEVEYYEEE
jgi:hypothetical protein